MSRGSGMTLAAAVAAAAAAAESSTVGRQLGDRERAALLEKLVAAAEDHARAERQRANELERRYRQLTGASLPSPAAAAGGAASSASADSLPNGRPRSGSFLKSLLSGLTASSGGAAMADAVSSSAASAPAATTTTAAVPAGAVTTKGGGSGDDDEETAAAAAATTTTGTRSLSSLPPAAETARREAVRVLEGLLCGAEVRALEAYSRGQDWDRANRELIEQLRDSKKNDHKIPYDELQFVEHIATGGGGEVWRGEWRGTPVAIKQTPREFQTDIQRRQFEKEIETLSSLRHPNVVFFIGAGSYREPGREQTTLYFLTELLRMTLRDLLHIHRKALSYRESVDLASDVAAGLCYLHLLRNPVLHRDIASGNILLDGQMRAKVADLGTAKVVDAERHADGAVKVMTIGPGARMYAAPEARLKSYTTKVDVYSFGILLTEMATGQFPDDERRDEQVAAIPWEPLRSLAARCLCQQPSSRPSIQKVVLKLDALKETPAYLASPAPSRLWFMLNQQQE